MKRQPRHRPLPLAIRRAFSADRLTLHRVARGVAVTLALARLAGCGSAETIEAAPVFALDREATSGIAAVDPDRTNVLPAALVRSLLQDLLTEHSDLSIEVMRQAVDGQVEAASLAALGA